MAGIDRRKQQVAYHCHSNTFVETWYGNKRRSMSYYILMKKAHITKTMTELYGTGRFNPQHFDRAGGTKAKRLYVWGIAIFLCAIALAVGFGMYVFGKGGASFTGEKVSLAIDGPNNPQSGEEETYTVTVRNNEDLALQDLELFIGFLTQNDGPSVLLVRAQSPAATEAGNSWLLPDVSSGGETSFEVTVRFLGSQSDELTVPFRLTFKPKGFSSEITLNESRLFTLGEPSIALTLDGPNSVSLGSEVALSVAVDAQTGTLNDDMRLSFAAPADFDVISFEPQLADGALDWRVGDLLTEDGKHTLLVRGTVSTNSDSALRFNARLRDLDGVILLEAQHEAAISGAKARLSIAAEPAQGQKLQWGETVTYTIRVANDAEYVMRDVVVSVQILNDDLWAPGSLSIKQGGTFESGSIIWDNTTTSAFESLRPGTDTTLAFSFTTRSEPPRSFSGVPALLAKAALHANLKDEDVTIESGETVTNILGTVKFDAAGWYTSPEGVLYGSGPNPPLPGQDTVYAIVWTVGPTSSVLENLEITTHLPPGIVWVNDASYSVGELSYDKSTRIVTWRSSRIPATALPFAIRFGVGISPSGQAASSEQLVERSAFKAIDSPTGEAMELYANPVTVGSAE